MNKELRFDWPSGHLLHACEIESALEDGWYPAIWLRCVKIGAEEKPTLGSGHDRTEIGLEPVAIVDLEMSFDPDINLSRKRRQGAVRRNLPNVPGAGRGRHEPG